jgi:hypothetical protein
MDPTTTQLSETTWEPRRRIEATAARGLRWKREARAYAEMIVITLL